MSSAGFIDPFIIAKFRSNESETKVQNRSSDPQWLEVLEFPARSTEIGNERLYLEVWHKGLVSDKQLGRVVVKLADIDLDSNEEIVAAIEKPPVKGKEKKQRRKSTEGGGDDDALGALKFKIKLKKPRENMEPDLLLRVAVLEAKKIPSRDRQDFADPYFVVSFEREIKKTQVRFRQTLFDRPAWSETFTFPAFSDRLDSALVVQCMDQQASSRVPPSATAPW